MKVNEIQKIPARNLHMVDKYQNSDFRYDGKTLLQITLNKAKPLPNSNYFYAKVPNVAAGGFNNYEICLINPDKQVVGVLAFQQAERTAYVQGIEVAKKFRGQGLATSLYGILLSVLKLNVISDSTQTPNGAKSWVKISKIPGVDVRGIVYNPTEEQAQALGATKYKENSWTFPVTIDNDQIVPAKNPKLQIYSTQNAGDFNLIAFYNKKRK